jgi:nicotinate phosphoribosyltransferase
MAHSHIPHIYRPNFGLVLDLYHLTMGYGFWKIGLSKRKAVFNLFYRKNPFDTPYTIVSGLQLAIDVLEGFQFSADDIQYLANLKGGDDKPLFEEGFLNYLQRMKLSCNVDAIPEGTPVFPNEPLIRVEGPLIQAQLLEAVLINVVNFSTLIATKSARMVQVAGDQEIIDFGLRRAHGLDGAITATRAAYIGGCHGTSNVIAGKMYDIPVKGTHAHSWVMIFDDEITSFREYAKVMPNNCIFLVDTYDTIEGVRNAIKVGHELREEGHEMAGIRLDSGDLAALSIEARKLLDEGGFEEAAIVASDQIDEYRIKKLNERGARVDIWGIGTRLVTSYDKPSLGGVYKITAVTDEAGAWFYRLKLSEEKIKITNPGIQQVRRLKDKDGIPVADMIYDLHLPYSQEIHDFEGNTSRNMENYDGDDLLVPVFREGKQVYDSPDVHEIRDRSLSQQALFKKVDWESYYRGLEKHLHDCKMELIESHREKTPAK